MSILQQQILNIFYLYMDGFRSMTIGRTLWKVVAIKLFVLFALIWPLLQTGTKSEREKETLVVSKLLK